MSAGLARLSARWLRRAALLATLVGSCVNAMAADGAGTIFYARGNVSVQSAGGGMRIVATGAPVAVGDAITTAAESFAVIELTDEERIVLRPGSTFKIEAFNANPGEESMTLNLIKGGIRALTGLIAKRRPESFRLHSPAATIGIRGTDFIARVCGPECAQGDGDGGHVGTPVPSVVGRALLVRGEVEALAVDGARRKVQKGTALFVGEVVKTAPLGYAVIAFPDETRVTVQPESDFRIDAYAVEPAQPTHENALFSLLRGGLRVATGLMASRRHESMHFNTRVATIGIRGTGFDLIESSECGGKSAPAGQPALTAQVWKGGIALAESQADVDAGQAVCVLERGQPATAVATKTDLGSPRPDEVEIPPDTFATASQSGTEEGTHVAVLDGHVVLSTDMGQIDLGRGEDGFSAGMGSAPARVSNERGVARGDPYFSLSPGGSLDTFDRFDGGYGLTCPVGS